MIEEEKPRDERAKRWTSESIQLTADGWGIYCDAHNVVLVTPSGRTSYYGTLADALVGLTHQRSAALPETLRELISQSKLAVEVAREVGTRLEAAFEAWRASASKT